MVFTKLMDLRMRSKGGKTTIGVELTLYYILLSPNLIILRNPQYWPKSLVTCKNICIVQYNVTFEIT